MRKIILVSVFSVLACLLLFAQGTRADDSIEIVGFEQDDILSSMDAVVMSCVDGAQNVRNSIVCQDNFQSLSLETFPVNSTCSISYVDLDEFGCVDLTIQAIFDRDGKRDKIAKTISTKQVIIVPRSILNTQQWDGGWDTASNTAYAIWILSQFKSRYISQINDGMKWLKQHREDDTKCWAPDPFTDTCSIYETSKTLAFLSFAGVNDTQRIKSDGRVWLESRQNYIENNDGWKLKINPSGDGNCSILAGSTSLASQMEMNDTEVYEFDFTPDYELLINFSCSMDYTFGIYDHNERNIFSRAVDEEDEFDFDYTITSTEDTDDDRSAVRYRFNPPCWSATEKWQYCNKDTTLYSLIPSIDEEQHDLAKEWFDEQLENDRIVGKYVRTANQYFDSALYLYAVDPDNEDVLEWLVYNQNNDGSWGSGTDRERALPTAMAILALSNKSFYSAKEVLSDARSWFSAQTPVGGWDSTKEDALTFMLLKDNARPFLKAQPAGIVTLRSEQTKVTLTNPTHKDANGIFVNISENLVGKIETSFSENVSAYTNETLTVSLKNDDAGTISGTISFYANISNTTNTTSLHDKLLLVLPLVINTSARLAVDVPQTVYVFNDTGSLDFTVTEINTPAQCTFIWDAQNVDLPSRLNVDGVRTYKLPLHVVPSRQSIPVSGIIECPTDYGHLSEEFSFTLESYPSVPFTIVEESRKLKTPLKVVSFTLINNLEEPLDISLSLADDSGLLGLDESVVTLQPAEKRKIPILNMVTKGTNVTQTAVLSASAMGLTDEAELDVSIIDRPFPIGLVITGTIVLLALCFIGFAGYLYWKKKDEFMGYVNTIVDFTNKEYANIYHVLPPAAAKYLPKPAAKFNPESSADSAQAPKRDDELPYYEEVVRIMRGLNKSDAEIKERLKAEGLATEQINKIMSTLKASDEIEQQIQHEDKVKKMLDVVGDVQGEIFKKLRDKGYSEKQIKEAIAELEGTVDVKEEELKKKFKDIE